MKVLLINFTGQSDQILNGMFSKESIKINNDLVYRKYSNVQTTLFPLIQKKLTALIFPDSWNNALQLMSKCMKITTDHKINQDNLPDMCAFFCHSKIVKKKSQKLCMDRKKKLNHMG